MRSDQILSQLNNVDLSRRLSGTRKLSLELASPLSAEDMTVQATADASPAKWHLAHTTWFFETFILQGHLPGYRVFDDKFNYCFNSYYESVGPRQERSTRGVLTRPSCERVFAYRQHVDDALEALLASDAGCHNDVLRLVEVGINHEQQHQELLLTDILALFAANPLRPAYAAFRPRVQHVSETAMQWIEFAGGIVNIGSSQVGFSWDNESPPHKALVHPFQLADRLVNNREWMDFMADDGYRTPQLWLSDGWTKLKLEEWHAPLYWEEVDGEWHSMSLAGLQPIDPSAPVTHINYFEADAFARWAGKRLPTEFEWEVAASGVPIEGNTLGTRNLRPVPAGPQFAGAPRQMFGDCWQWTQSAYLPYPGYRPPDGALGEYNGKFMVSQHVLRGASCATPDGHTRSSYRNFFYPQQRWQFTGVRLAAEGA